MAKNNTSPKKTESPAKATPSPPRKSSTNREKSVRLDKLTSANMIKCFEVGIENVGIGVILKSDGQSPAFTGKILGFIEGNAEHMLQGQVMLFSKLRNPNGSNEHLETINKQGNKYPTDVVVFSTENQTLGGACHNLAKLMNSISKNECVEDWKFGTPMFVSKGVVPRVDVLPLSHYLLNEECVTVIKRIYENCDTKKAFLNNEYKDTILETVFGDHEYGNQIIDEIIEELYDEL